MEKIKKTNAYKVYMERAITLQKTQITLLKMIGVVLKRIQAYDRSIKLFEKIQRVSPETKKRLDDINKKRQDLTQISDDYENNEYTILEMFFVASINAYLIFIQDLMSELFCKAPELLGNKEIKLYEVIQKNDIKSIVRETVELTVAQNMYKDFKDLCKYIAQKFKINMYKDDSELNKIYLRIQMRNLFVHNNGIINKKFIERTKSIRKVGQKIKMNDAYLDKTTNLFIENVDFISEQTFSF